jgi:O-antigen/teichoic acid export membrane protein
MGLVQKEALRSTIYSYLGLFLGYLNKGFLFVILLKSYQIGLINLLVASGTLFSQLANFGSMNVLLRFFPIMRNPKKKDNGFFALNVMISAFGAVIVSLLILLFNDSIKEYYSHKSEQYAYYFWLVIPVGVGALLYRILEMYLMVLYKTVFSIVARDIIFRLVVTVLLVVFSFDLMSFNQLVILICLSQWVPSILLIVYIKWLGEWHFNISDINVSRRMKKIILNYASLSYFNSIGTSVVLALDILMIAGMLGLDETGVYTTVIFISRLLTIPYSSLMRISVPLVTEYWKEKNMKKMLSIYQKVSSVSLITGLFLFLGIWINRVEVFGFFPKGFEAGQYVFLFLIIGRLIDMYFGLNGAILITSKKFANDIYFTLSLLITVFILNLFFIPWLGIYGAAISTTLAYAFINSARLIFVWYKFGIHPFKKEQLYVMILFAGVLCLFEFIPMDLGSIIANIALKSVVCTLFFPLVIYLLKIDMDIVNYTNAILKKLKLMK